MRLVLSGRPIKAYTCYGYGVLVTHALYFHSFAMYRVISIGCHTCVSFSETIRTLIVPPQDRKVLCYGCYCLAWLGQPCATVEEKKEYIKKKSFDGRMQKLSHLSYILCTTLMCSINVAVANLWLSCRLLLSCAGFDSALSLLSTVQQKSL